MRISINALCIPFGKGMHSIIAGAFLILFSNLAKAQCLPEFDGTPQNVSVSCTDAIPAFDACSAASSCCDGPVTMSTFVSENGAIVRDCIIHTAYGPGPDWSIWLPQIAAPSVTWNFTGEAHLQVYEDGTGHLWGTIANSADPSMQFVVDMWLQHGKNWADWSALGRSYKNDLGLAGNNYLDWMYYELVPGFAHLQGAGSIEGSYLELSHQPTNFFYGFQMGVAANNKNANDGFSGWFTYTGTFNDTDVTGHGDVNVDETCTNGPSGCAATAFTQICRAEDACGSIAFQTQTITITDDQAPVVDSYESVLSLPCTADLNFAITGTDNCSEVFVTHVDEIIVPGCGGQFIRHYTVSDGCGNSVTVDQTVNLLSEGEPEFTIFPTNIDLNCDEVDQLLDPQVEWTSTCANTELTVTEEIVAGDCPGNYTMLRIYTLTDACGNEVSQTWTVNVQDNTPPQIFNVPANGSISCGQNIPPALPTVIDNCDPNVNVTLEAITEQLDCGYNFIRTWTAVDACGNTSTASQAIHVIDELDPVYTFVPPNVTATCEEGFELDMAIVTDQCSSVELNWTDIPLDDCAGSYMRIWRAFDGCGNSKVAYTTVTLVDNTAPVMTVFPADVEVSCDAVPPVTNNLIAYTDNCGAVTKQFSESTVAGDCPGNYTLNRTWTLTDDCGNSSQWTWHIQVSDNVPPVILGVPADASINCGDNIAEAVVVALDNCDDQVMVALDATTEPAECGYTFVRTWTATDHCGNVTVLSQTIMVNDQEDPQFSFVPSDIAISCGSGVSLDDLEIATATDDCSNVIVTFEDTPIGSNCGDGILRVFTATDACGNSIQEQQIISFSDSEPPVFTFVPDDQIGPCGGTVTLANAIATDNCSTPVVTFVDTPGAGCAGSFVRTYTATDGCGNTATAEVIVSFSDNESPTFTNAPADTQVNCDQVPTTESAQIEFSDNCGSVDVVFDETILSNGACPGSYEIVRTWTISDECGNSSAYEWNIIVSDNTAPTLSGVPTDTSLNCGEVVSDAVVVAIDNCDDNVLVSLSATTEQNECGYDFVRTWTATDACGNTHSESQTIHFTDNNPPSFVTIPATLNLNCDGTGAGDIEPATATDDCSSVTVTFVDLIGTDGCAGGFTRQWIATDGCGNVTTANQIINVSDDQAPIITNFPANGTVSCSEIPTIESAQVTFEDNCGNVTTNVAEVITPGECPNSYMLERTWTFTDACGNETAQTWTLLVIDEEAPQVFGVPANTSINCGDPIEEAVVFATDNCSAPENIEISLHAKTNESPCGYIFVRVWTVTDECGNSTVLTQEITVNDNDAPVFTFVPPSIEAPCGQELILEEATATDDCSDLNITTSIIPSDDCAGSFTRIFTATDGCGNFTTASQVVTIVDDVNPLPSFEPTDMIVNCGEVPVFNEDYITFTDNCSSVDVFMTVDVPVVTCLGNYVLIYSWIAQDACGNRTTVDMAINVKDEVAPEFNGLPEDLILPCGSDIPLPAAVSATDNCGQIGIDIVENTIFTDCGFVIERTFIATDDCGNSTEYMQTITFEDIVGPQFSDVPPNLELSCDQPVPGVSMPSAFDLCSGAADVTVNEEIVDGDCISNYTVVRTFSAMDLCGNVNSVVQTIAVSDVEPPDFSDFTSQIAVACTESNGAFISAFDNCSVVDLTYSDVFFEDDCAGGLTRTYRAEDACGNVAFATQVMDLIDNEVPVFNESTLPPATVSYSCTDVPTADSYAIEFSDDCSNTTISLSEEITPGDIDCPNSYVLTRTWTISDGCGNSSTATSVISVFDNEAPQIIGVPVSLTIDCTDDIPPADVFAIDNCDPDVQLSLNATTETIGCTTYFIRRWNAVDACDNLTSAVQTIIISDLQDPILSEYPADLTLPCGELAPTAPDITVTDNCDADVQVVFTETTSGNPDCPNLTRTWCATDCTGNEVCHTQNINFIPVPGASTMDQLSAWQASPSEIIIKTLTVEQSKWNLEVYDVTGRMVQTIYSGDMNAQDQRQFVLDISHFNDAMYIIKFNNGETLITKNVVIIR